jgi:hypothetical protein
VSEIVTLKFLLARQILNMNLDVAEDSIEVLLLELFLDVVERVELSVPTY